MRGATPEPRRRGVHLHGDAARAYARDRRAHHRPVHVRDTARALVALAGCDAAVGEVVNVATGEDHAIGDVAAAIVARLAPGTPVVCDPARVRRATSEVDCLRGDASRLLALSGVRPAVAFRDGLDETLAWYADPAHLARCGAPGYAV